MNRVRLLVLLLVLLAAAALVEAVAGEKDPPPGSEGDPARVVAPGLLNVYRITHRLLSGSSPEGDEGFRSLRQLGVRTILSVDGARPDVERARQQGLRYVHLPIGYDGVPREQALRIARAIRDLPGPVYLHCHHGKHRGPAAAAVAHLFLDSSCSPQDAVAELRRAGTDPRYRGLYAAPATLRRPTAAELDSVPADFPEISAVAALAQRMVQIDERWHHLTLARAAGWKMPREHPDVDPPHEAVQLAEHYREAARLAEVRQGPAEQHRWMLAAAEAARALETALRQGDATAAERWYREGAKACATCHARYRDVPRAERRGADAP